MASTTVRISESARDTLKEVAKATGRSMSEIMEQSVRSYYEQLILDQSNAAYAEIKLEQSDWDDVLTERALLEGTILDGLDRE